MTLRSDPSAPVIHMDVMYADNAGAVIGQGDNFYEFKPGDE